MVPVSERAKGGFDVGGFLEKHDAAIGQPAVVGFPSLALRHHFVGRHYSLYGKQAEETELGEAAETNSRFHVQFFEPDLCCIEVNMASVSEGNPYVHIREKK